MFSRITAALALLAITTITFAKDKKEHDWKTAKVLDSRLAKTSAPTGSTVSASGTSTTVTTGNVTTTSSQGGASAATDYANIRDDQLLLLSDEFAYVVEDTRVSGGHGLVAVTAHAVANRKHGCHFIVGDPVKFWQDKAVLHVIDADGKECKVDVLRQERLKPSP